MKNTKKQNKLGTEPILSLLFKLSIPSIISMAIQALYNIVDSIYIGHLSSDALTALSIAFPIQMILIAIAVGTGVGTSSLISRLLGSDNNKRASNVAEHVLIISFVYGILICILGLFFSKDLIKLFSDNPTLINYGSRYIKIILIGSVALFLPMIGNNILRGEGNTFIPMITMLIGSILNIIFDPLLIFGIGFFPKLGIEGAAIATVGSRIISGSFILFMLLSDKNQVKIKMKNFKYDFSIIKDIYKVGLPAMIMQLLASFMVGSLNLIVGNYDENAIAALGIYFKLQSFVFMPVFGLNQGYMPIIGFNYGNGKKLRMKKTIKYGFITAFSITFTGFIIFQLFSFQLVKMFTSDKELIELGKTSLKSISLAFPIIGPAIIGSTTFQAVGKGIPSLTLSFLRQIILLIPLAYILGKIGGLNIIWYAFPISEVIAAFIMVFWLKNEMNNVFTRME